MSSYEAIRYFDEAAEEYASRYVEPTPGGSALRIRQQRILEMIEQPGGRVLDLGCGPGVLAQELVDRGHEVWGVDAAPGMIEQSRKRLAGHKLARFAVADIAELALPDEFFDVVVCTGVIDHGKAHHAVIREMLRVAKVGGTLLISFPNVFSPYALWKTTVFYPTVALLRPIYYRLAGRREPSTLYRSQTPRSWLSDLGRLRTVRQPSSFIEKLGAEITDMVYFHYNPFLSPLDEVFPRLALTATDKLERFHTGQLRWLGAGFILKARKLPEGSVQT